MIAAQPTAKIPARLDIPLCSMGGSGVDSRPCFCICCRCPAAEALSRVPLTRFLGVLLIYLVALTAASPSGTRW